jgi:hypothetical protein
MPGTRGGLPPISTVRDVVNDIDVSVRAMVRRG